MKVTPAHDPNDFECGRRHNLEEINVLTEDGRMNENGGKYAGMMRFDCRFQILKDLGASVCYAYCPCSLVPASIINTIAHFHAIYASASDPASLAHSDLALFSSARL